MPRNRSGQLVSALLGWALFGSWPLAAFMTSSLAPLGAEAGQGLPPSFWTISLASLCATLVALTAFEKLVMPRIRSKKPRGAATAILLLSCAGMLVAGCLPDSPAARVCGIVGAVASGASSAFLHVTWQSVLADLTWNEIDVLVPLGYGGSLLVGFVVSAMPALVETAILFASLLASGIVLLRCDESALMGYPASAKSGQGRAPADAGGEGAASFALSTWMRSAVVVLVMWIPIVFVEDSVVADRALSNTVFLMAVGAGALVAVAVSYVAYAFVKAADFSLVVTVTVPLAAMSLCALCFLPQNLHVVAYVLSFAANTLMSIFLRLASISYAKRGACSILRSTTCVLMPLYFASFVSSLASPLLVRIDPLEVGFLSLLALLLAVMFVTPCGTGVGALVFGARAHGAARAPSEEGSGERQPERPTDPVSLIVDRYRLTKREAEVLELFAAGRDSGYIREALFISRDTVNTHLKHIYAKLGIHSKRELLDLVEACREGSSGT